MRFSALALALLLTCAAPATAALAAVQSPANQAREAQEALKAAHLDRFQVVFVDTANGRDVIAGAKSLFTQRGLGPENGLILVALEDRKVGVHLGERFADEGVSGAVITRETRRVFVPAARRGDYVGGAVALARALEQARTPMGANRRASNGGGRSSGGGGLGFLWVVGGLGLVGGGAYAFARSRSRKKLVAQTALRLQKLQEQQTRLASDVVALDARGRQIVGPENAAHKHLKKLSRELLAQSESLQARIAEAQAALDQKDANKALATIQASEGVAFLLEAALNAAMTGYDVAAREASPQAIEALMKASSQAARRYQELQAYGGPLREESPGNASVQLMTDRLEEARKALTDAPVAPEAATSALDEAEKLLDELTAHKERTLERSGASGGGDWDFRPVNVTYMPPIFIPMDTHSHSGYDDDRRHDWGSSGGDSWDSGSSGGDSWDSGSSGGDSW